MNLYTKPFLRDILVSKKINCIIVDRLLGSLTTDLAAELGIRNIQFCVISCGCFWAHFCVLKLFECSELPIRGEKDLDHIISNIPGMENLLRCRDLASFCRANKMNHISLDSVVLRTQQSLATDTLILNTFEDPEGPVLSHIRLRFPKLYSLGPLHHHLHTRKTAAIESVKSSASFFQMDRSCMPWLDA